MWAGGLLRVWGSTPEFLSPMLAPVLASLRAGRRQGRFTYRDEDAAADLAVGTVAAAMVRVLARRRDKDTSPFIAALILRGLGIHSAEADEIASRPLPHALGRQDEADEARSFVTEETTLTCLCNPSGWGRRSA
jgi:hypothetical protein